MNPLLLISIGGIVLTIGDIVFKFWVEKPQPMLYVVGLLVYLIGAVFLVESFKTQNIAIASVVYIIVNVVTLVLVSWFYFGEKLSLIELVGIALAIIAIFLLEFGK